MGVFAVGEGKEWGGRCIPACATSGWYGSGERREESCKNREVPHRLIREGRSPAGLAEGNTSGKKEGKRI